MILPYFNFFFNGLKRNNIETETPTADARGIVGVSLKKPRMESEASKIESGSFSTYLCMAEVPFHERV